MDHPTENLVRVLGNTVWERSESESSRTMTVDFAVYNEWTEIDDPFEGHFMERIAPGAFSEAGKTRPVRVMYHHGRDMTIGTKPLGKMLGITDVDQRARATVDLFDASYVRDLEPAFRAGEMGASFRGSIPDGGVQTAYPSRTTDHNPSRLPERTITRFDLWEIGPTPLPAYASTSVGMRSMTDDWLQSFLSDPVFVARMTERMGATVIEKITATAASHDLSEPADGGTGEPPVLVPADGGTPLSLARAKARALALRSFQ